MSDKRSFTVLRVKDSNGRSLRRFNGGRYLSSTPMNAVKKSSSQICREISVKGQCAFVITLRETTQGSNHNEYCYKVKRVLDPVTVVHDGVEITHNYRVEAHAHHE